ncbi:MAG TPA: AraC family transcriptional regulator [Rhodocyclaceae bacterium]|nr:AraC family transcriptional regulator [Rhodocyclaceae bacterium]
MKGAKSTNKLSFYLARMAARGFTAEQVLAGTGLNAERIFSDAFRANPQQYRQVILNIVELTGDPCIGIAIGAEFKISYLGVLGYAALSAATLEQAREVFTRYHSLSEHIFTSTNHISDGRWFSEIRDTFMLGDVIRFAVEEFVSRTIELASSITNKPFPILEMYLTYAPPADLAPYVRRFNCPLHFNQPRNIVVFDINCLQDPVSLANQEVFNLCERQCQLLASKNEEDDLLSNRIRNYLVKNPGKFPTLEEMAEHLNIGSRTLRRRLVKEQITFQSILDETRRELAIQYLKYTSLTPKQIGFLLGYSSVSNFRRAFKSWTGKKLSDFREGSE